jgi:REP element-mobilizing transposase RayT
MPVNFNLPSPIGFRGLDEHRPVRRYERHLPHWRQDGATYFVTFNLADAIPVSKHREIESLRRDWEHRNPHPRNEQSWKDYAKTVYGMAEKFLDAGYGKCWFQFQAYADELHRSILHFHGQRYELGCFVIMVNHCHLAIRPKEGIDLEKELGGIKRVTSRFINESEGLRGPIWNQESYDSIIRDEEHLYRVVQYIGSNPGRAGLPATQWRRWINPEWERAGWRFDN